MVNLVTTKAQTIALLAPASMLLLATGVLPLGLVLYYSLNESFGSDFMFVGSQWYAKMLSSPEFIFSVLRSFVFSGLALAFEMPLGLLIALRLPRDGKLASTLVVLMVLPLLTPNLVVGYLFKALALPQVGLLTWLVSLFGYDLDLKSTIVAWFLLLIMDICTGQALLCSLPTLASKQYRTNITAPRRLTLPALGAPSDMFSFRG